MHDVVDKLISIQEKIQIKNNKTKIVVVSKTFPIEDVIPLIKHGHKDFGENKIQEALKKWVLVKKEYDDIKLHMIGKIQSNKVKIMMPLFDYLHSLDSLKLAQKISEEQKKFETKIKIFIQINIGDELQKSGIAPNEVESFKKKCIDELNLDVIGLMCLPPKNKEPNVYFEEMNNLLKKTDLNELSMGMSNDYLEATDYNSTFVRIGSKIFGDRS
tara:strand:+ start:560 stop:1204 length:645 start_codon:yes stop_codon:yes gene_type:complete